MFHAPICLKSSLHPRGTRVAAACSVTLAAIGLLLVPASASAQGAAAGTQGGTRPRFSSGPRGTHETVNIPEASRVKAGDAGMRAHANIRYVLPQGATPSEAPPYSGYGYETPASLACIYHLVAPIAGCNPNSTINTPSGGSQTIAIVDAFDDPNAASDLQAFSTQFGLPFSDEKFRVVYAGGSAPPVDPSGGWELEESLDIEYAHAMAPNARLYLVEADSNSFSDLLTAVQVANNLIACGRKAHCPAGSRGRGEISMSWGGGEFPGETSLDAFFTAPGVVYFAAAGDGAGVIYPCASPNVVCAGGTSTARNENTGDLIAEIAWSDAGGGISFYEPVPSYQSAVPGIANQLGGYRGTPDLSADSNPNTGLWVLDNFPVDGLYTGWFTVGGTSAASPTLAGVVNARGTFALSSGAELSTLYSSHRAGYFNDISYGACGYYSGSFSGPGWDLCTGLGSPGSLGAR